MELQEECRISGATHVKTPPGAFSLSTERIASGPDFLLHRGSQPASILREAIRPCNLVADAFARGEGFATMSRSHILRVGARLRAKIVVLRQAEAPGI